MEQQIKTKDMCKGGESHPDISRKKAIYLDDNKEIFRKRINGELKIFYRCKCNCGNYFEIRKTSYLRNKLKSKSTLVCESCRVKKQKHKWENYKSLQDDLNTKNKSDFLKNLYYAMDSRSCEKGFGRLPFTKEKFVSEYINHYDFVVLWDKYIEEDKPKELAPSVDRINPRLGYFFENMKFISWKENKEKGYKELKMMKGVPIEVYELETDELLMKFNSIQDAADYTNLPQSNIIKNLNGERNYVDKFYFKRAVPNNKKLDIYSLVKEVIGR